MAGHPSNENILYLISRSSITKATLTGSGNNVSSNSVSREVVGRFGSINPNTYNPTSKSAIRFRSLRDIKIDHALNRIFVADGHQRMVQSFDLDMNYHDHSGYSSRQTRMAGAHEAIQSLVTDSSLVSSVNFGFGYWSHDASSYIYYSGRKYNNNYVPCRNFVGNPSWLTSRHWLVRYNYWCYKPCLLYTSPSPRD